MRRLFKDARPAGRANVLRVASNLPGCQDGVASDRCQHGVAIDRFQDRVALDRCHDVVAHNESGLGIFQYIPREMVLQCFNTHPPPRKWLSSVTMHRSGTM